MVACLGAALLSYSREDEALAERLIWLAAGLFAALAFVIAVREGESGAFLQGLYIDDPFARFGKVAALLSAAILLLISLRHLEATGHLRSTYPICVALAVLGIMLAFSAGDLILLVMGIELCSAAFFLLARLRRFAPDPGDQSARHRESLLASGLVLAGVAGVVLLTERTGLAALSESMQLAAEQNHGLAVYAAAIALAVGLLLKLFAAPFALWRPDTGRHVSIPLAALLSTLPKLLLLAVLVRFCYLGLLPLEQIWRPVLAVLGLAAVIVGGLVALSQTELKGLIAHTGLAQFGLVLLALALWSDAGLAAALIMLAVLVVLQLGLYAFVLSMQSDGRPITAMSALAGISARAPAHALALLLILLALAGLPPLIGFAGKIGLLLAAVEPGLAPFWLWLVCLAALAFLPTCVAYLRVVLVIYSAQDDEVLNGRTEPVPLLTLIGVAVLAVFGGVSLLGLEGWANAAAASFDFR